MTTPDRKGLDTGAILNDLYASEINASISWIWDGGFYATLGNPQQAEGWAFPTVGEVVAWLRDKNTAASYSAPTHVAIYGNLG